jgi:hypothetical protein
MKRTRSYSSDTKSATVAFVKSTPEWGEIQNGARERLPHPVLSQAQVLSGGASTDAIHRWLFEDISPSAEKERLSHRGAKTVLADDLIKLAIGYAVDPRLDLQAVDRERIIDFVHGFCGIKPQPQRVSEWLLAHGFSSQMSLARSSRMTDLDVANEAVDFLLELRARKLQPNQILVMDETGLWSNTVERLTYNFKNLSVIQTFLSLLIFALSLGFPRLRLSVSHRSFHLTQLYFPNILPIIDLLNASGNAVVEQTGDTYRDTMAATLVGDGSFLPPFYIKGELGNASKASHRRPKPGQKPVKGMNVPNMLKYLDHVDKHVDRPCVLLLDRLSSHRSKRVRDYAYSLKCSDGVTQKFELSLLPAKSAFLISPLDMGFFSMWKRGFYKYDRSTYAFKLLAAHHVWKSIQSKKIRGLFDNCGITSKETPSKLRKRIIAQVRSGIPEELEEVWEFYQGWLAGSFEIQGATRPRSDPKKKLIIPPDCDLDGAYWVKMGPHKKS